MYNEIIVIILCCLGFIGLGGLHDFYMGNKMWGWIKLLTLNFFFIGTIYDLYRIINQKYDPLIKNPIEDMVREARFKQYSKTHKEQPHELTYEISGMEWEQGTEAQINWADDLVARYVERIKEDIKEAVENNRLTQEEAEKLEKKIMHEIIFKDNASWWIDRRTESERKLTYLILEDYEEFKDIARKI